MRTWIEISRQALEENLRALLSLVEPGVVFCAIVKAQAYGHGIAQVVEVCASQGVDHFGVDSVEEAREVRALVPEATIFIMGAQSPEAYAEVVRGRYIVTCSSAEEVCAYAACARELGIPVQITAEIETGLHRLGAQERKWRQVYEAVERHAGWVFVQSIASHFASSERLEATWETKHQNTIFCDAINRWNSWGVYPHYQHIACSAAMVLEPTMQHTMVRAGIMLYGLWPSADVKRQGTLGRRHAQLSPVLRWKTRLVHVEDVAPGEGIGYGGSYRANRPMRIGVIPVGYYDGYDRRAGEGECFAIIRGARCPIVGRICMNMCMVDLGGAPSQTRVGDEVTLLGRDGLSLVTADDLAQAWGTIHYEVVTCIGAHLPRILV